MAKDPIKSLIYKLHSTLKQDDFWPQFMEAIGEEYEDNKLVEIDKKIIFNNVYELEEDGVIRLMKTFGYTPNLILDTSYEYTLLEALSVPFRIKRKTTYQGYELGFKLQDRIGKIYNLFWNGNKLIKVIDVSDTWANINSHALNTPFCGVDPDKNFSTIFDLATSLDVGLFLDDTELEWHLDQSINILPTKYLTVELCLTEIIEKEGIEYLMTSEWCKYLDTNKEYNKRAIDVPYSGGQIVSILDQSGYYNNLFPLQDYSIPDIKLQSGTTLYKEKLGRDLVEDDYFYIVAGKGSVSLEDSNIPIFSPSRFIVAYTFDENGGEECYDLSSNNYNATINGEYKRVDSIIGQSVDFFNSTVTSDDAITFSNIDMTYSFWLNVNDLPDILNELFTDSVIGSPDPGKLEFIGASNISSDPSDQTYRFRVDHLDIVPSITTILNKNQDYLIHVEIDSINTDIRLYIDGVFIDTLDYSSSPDFSGLRKIRLNDGGMETYIDSFFIYTGFFTQSQKEEMYNNKVSIFNNLSSPIFRQEIDGGQIWEDSNWFLIDGIIEGNSVKYEYQFTKEDGTETYMATTNITNLIPNYFALTYEREDGTLEEVNIFDDGNGSFEDDFITGTINYNTGELEVTFYHDYSVNGEVLVDGGDVSSLSVALANTDLLEEANTHFIYYFFGGTQYVGEIDALGNITGTNISSGTVNFEDGTVTITFTGTVDAIDITMNYIYRKTPTLSGSRKVYTQYKSYDSIEITELGLMDENENLIAYSTFPPVQLANYRNHLSSLFLINKN